MQQCGLGREKYAARWQTPRSADNHQLVPAIPTTSIGRKIPYVTAHSVTGALATNPSALRGKTIRDLQQTLAQDGDLGAAIVDMVGQLVLRVEQLQAEIAALRVALPANVVPARSGQRR